MQVKQGGLAIWEQHRRQACSIGSVTSSVHRGAARVPIQVGVSDGTRTVVLAGLQEGDTVKLP